jgi:hypothetical protein
VSARWPIPRPTEHAAIRRVVANPEPGPDLVTLFEGILNAHNTGDRHGLSLFGHAIARIGGGQR